MANLAQHIIALLTSTCVLAASMNCVCAGAASSADCHKAAAAATTKKCCMSEGRSARDGKGPSLPCDSQHNHKPGCQHCQPAIAAQSTDIHSVLSHGFPSPQLSALPPQSWALIAETSLQPANLGSATPRSPGGRALLRLHCELII